MTSLYKLLASDTGCPSRTGQPAAGRVDDTANQAIEAVRGRQGSTVEGAGVANDDSESSIQGMGIHEAVLNHSGGEDDKKSARVSAHVAVAIWLRLPLFAFEARAAEVSKQPPGNSLAREQM